MLLAVAVCNSAAELRVDVAVAVLLLVVVAGFVAAVASAGWISLYRALTCFACQKSLFVLSRVESVLGLDPRLAVDLHGAWAWVPKKKDSVM